MRLLGLMFAGFCCVGLNSTHAYAQGDTPKAEEQQLEPYHKHRDTRHGHDHSYPDRGALLRDLPRGTIGVSYAGVSYRFHDGVWMEPRGPAFMVVAPPIGLVIPNLPAFTTVLAQGGQTYLYVNDVYYRPRPDLGGYEVINDPTEAAAQVGPATFTGGQVPGAATPAPQPTAAQIAVPAAMIVAAAPTATGGASSGTLSAGTAVAPSTVGSGPSLSAGSAAAPPGSPTASPSTPGTTPATTSGLAGPTAASPGSPSATAPSVEAASGTSAAPALAAATVATTASQSTTSKGSKVFIYPRNGQSSDQQEHDRHDCYRFAVAQSGLDPMHPPGGAVPATAELQADFDRAQSACFDARGYTMR